jgi:hypothetical protein
MTTAPAGVRNERRGPVRDGRLAGRGQAMVAKSDLQIGLHRWNTESCAVELRYSQPGSDADT